MNVKAGARPRGPEDPPEARGRALSVRERSEASDAGPESGRHAVSGPRPPGRVAADWDRLTNAEACQRILELLRTGRGGRMTREAGG